MGEKPAIKKITFNVIRTRLPARWRLKLAISTCCTETKGYYRSIPSPALARTRLTIPNCHSRFKTVMLALNTAKAPTNELAVREALNYAVNKKSLIDNALYGTQQVADTLFAPSVPTRTLA
ncbi:ABC transporter substrate-binding protein [Escherichia coli]